MYSEKYFGVHVNDVTVETLTHFFTEKKEESDTLEFKSFHGTGQKDIKSKENGILKTICAFLNSSGGLLIWGAPVEMKDDGTNECYVQGDLSPVENHYSKDTFISKIVNRITAAPNGISFSRIQIDEARYVYLFDVSESDVQPHQFDSIYYMRLDGQTQKMPHNVIESQFKKIRFPNLGGYIAINEVSYNRDRVSLDISPMIINHSGYQNEELVFFQLASPQAKFIRTPINDHDPRISYKLNDHMLECKGLVDILFYGSVPVLPLSIEVNEKVLKENGNQLELLLLFGGKYSPMKQTHYVLDGELLLHGAKVRDLFISESHNVLLHDFGLDKGTLSDKVSELLGRRIIV